MRFSVWPTLSQPWADVLAVVRHAEASGWDGVYVADHFMGSGGDWGPDTTPNLEATAGRGAELLGARSRGPPPKPKLIPKRNSMPFETRGSRPSAGVENESR